VERVIDGRSLASIAPVNAVWVGTDRFVVDHTPIALFAANGAANRHPQAGLPAIADI
jgi:hypothetical protein